MKLYWSNRSPFVRKVWIALHEKGLMANAELVGTFVAPDKPNPTVQAANPLSKIPTLVLDDGTALYDSRVICEYLDALSARNPLFPASGAARWTALRRQALGDGFLDFVLLWRGEKLRPEAQRSQPHLAAFAQKAAQVLARLEAEAGDLAATPFDIGHVAIGCALSYLDFRFPDLEWRKGRDRLHAWHRSFETRHSVQATVIVNDEAA